MTKVLIEERGRKAAMAPWRGAKGKAKRIAARLLEGLGCGEVELSLLLTDNETIRELNSNYRGKDRATDVLSFPMDDPVLMGDVVISLETAAVQADSYGVTTDEELSRLLVHGILHLLGYDHVNGGRQAAKMTGKESELMALLREDGFFQ